MLALTASKNLTALSINGLEMILISCPLIVNKKMSLKR
jgi:hypothetical protein